MQRFGERSFDRIRDVRAQRPDRDRLAAEPRDHHFLRVASLKGQLAGEHLERHDAEGVDIAARVERLAADLLRTHELGRAQDDPGRGELGDRRVGAPLLGQTEVHHYGALGAGSVVGHQHDVLGLQVAVNDLQLVRMVQARAHLFEQHHAQRHVHRSTANLAVGEQLALQEGHHQIDQAVL